MRVLLDTCILSELRHPNGNDSVRGAVSDLRTEDLFISVISLGEIIKGVTLLEAGRRQQDLLGWVRRLEQDYADRLLPIDLEIVGIWGEMTAMAQKKGRIVSVCDGLIAATALGHGLHLMTRNVSDFDPTGVMLINPWESG